VGECDYLALLSMLMIFNASDMILDDFLKGLFLLCSYSGCLLKINSSRIIEEKGRLKLYFEHLT